MTARRARPEGRPVASTARSFIYLDPETDNDALRTRLLGACAGHDYFTSMLSDDVARVLPYDIGGGSPFTATLTGPGAATAETLLPAALDEERYRHSTLNDVLRDFTHRAAALLVTCGPLTYEVGIIQYIDVDPPDPHSFELRLVQPGSLDSLSGTPIQYVTQATPDTRIHFGMYYLELDPARLVTIRLDPTTERDVADAVAFLQEASSQHQNEGDLMDQAMRCQGPYDWSAHHRSTGDLIAAATVPIGWAARTLYRDRRLDPYTVWRSLQFLAFKIRVREAILAGINAALTIAGSVLGYEARLEITGLPTMADVTQAENDLETGQRSLPDMIRMAL